MLPLHAATKGRAFHFDIVKDVSGGRAARAAVGIGHVAIGQCAEQHQHVSWMNWLSVHPVLQAVLSLNI
jgi:hypothetical protein